MAAAPLSKTSDWVLPANSIPAGYTLHMPYGSVPQYSDRETQR